MRLYVDGDECYLTPCYPGQSVDPYVHSLECDCGDRLSYRWFQMRDLCNVKATFRGWNLEFLAVQKGQSRREGLRLHFDKGDDVICFFGWRDGYRVDFEQCYVDTKLVDEFVDLATAFADGFDMIEFAPIS